MKLIYDLLSGVHNNGGEIDSPTWKTVASQIQALDGKNRTLVVLQRGQSSIMIGGGPDYCICVVTLADGRMFNAADISKVPDKDVEIKAGGQFGEYPAKYAVHKNVATRAAEVFFQNGMVDTGLTWESE
jgi:hypothetical protein